MRNKRFLVLLAMLMVLVFVVPSSFAQARFSIRTSRPNTSMGPSILTDAEGNAMDYGVWVYGISIYAGSTNAVAAIYDVSTLAALEVSRTYPKYEIGEPTQYDITTEWFTSPIYYSNGVGIDESGTSGNVFVHYGPAPN